MALNSVNGRLRERCNQLIQPIQGNIWAIDILMIILVARITELTHWFPWIKPLHFSLQFTLLRHGFVSACGGACPFLMRLCLFLFYLSESISSEIFVDLKV